MRLGYRLTGGAKPPVGYSWVADGTPAGAILLVTQRLSKVRDQPVREDDRVRGREVGPLGALETRELRIVLEIDAGGAGCRQEVVPGPLPGSGGILEFLEFSGHREADEDHLAAARPR